MFCYGTASITATNMSTETIPLLRRSNYSKDFQTFSDSPQNHNSYSNSRESCWSNSKERNSLNYQRSSECGPGTIGIDNPAFLLNSQGVPIQKMSWLIPPASTSIENCLLPAFSVQANPGVTDTIQVVAHSCGEGIVQIVGNRNATFRVKGPTKPSIATFADVAIRRAGKYVLEVRSIRNPDTSLVAEFPLTVEPKTDSYESYRIRCTTLPEEVNRMQMFGV